MRPNRIRLKFELLEKRQLLAADVSLGTLDVSFDGPDSVTDSAFIGTTVPSASVEAGGEVEDPPADDPVEEASESRADSDDPFAGAEGEFFPSEELLPVQVPSDPFRQTNDRTDERPSTVLFQRGALPDQSSSIGAVLSGLRVFDYEFEEEASDDTPNEELEGELDGEAFEDGSTEEHAEEVTATDVEKAAKRRTESYDQDSVDSHEKPGDQETNEIEGQRNSEQDKGAEAAA